MEKISLYQGHRKVKFTVVVLIINIVEHFVIVVVVSEKFYFKFERKGPEKSDYRGYMQRIEQN